MIPTTDLRDHYARLLLQHGDGPQAVQWADVATQEQRFRILAEVGGLGGAKVLDFGCGTGHLLHFLRRECAFDGAYVGLDLCPEMLAVARAKFADARFVCRDVLRDGLDEDFDVVFVSGVFNNRVGDDWARTTATLRLLFSHTRRALAFNALSTYVDRFDDGLNYVDPERLFAFAKSLSPLVTLRHDYCVRPGVVPYEFTVYVHRTDIAARAALRPASEGER